MSVSVEVAAINDFLVSCPPFDQLPEQLLLLAARHIEIRYFRAGEVLSSDDYSTPCLYIVRSGAFEIRDNQGQLVDRLAEGDFMGYTMILTGDTVNHNLSVLEDGLIYELGEGIFQELRSKCRPFERFFNRAHAKRLRHAVRFRQQNHVLTQRVGDLNHRDPITALPSESLNLVAQRMTEARVSSMMVVDETGQLCGLATDRDMRARVVAEGLAVDTPVSAIMTENIISLTPESLVFEAMLAMTEHNIHHLPVTHLGKPVAMLTTTDLVKSQKSDPILLIHSIGRQTDVPGLVEICRDIPELLRSLIRAEASADQIGRLLTTVTDALTRQLLKLATKELGEAPVDYAWLAFGSQGRMDQTAISDQDNGLLLSDAYTQGDAAYFEKLAAFVNDGLDACGYVYCPGDVMASNPTWRQPLVGWKKQFLNWINQPSSKALMHASIFFDMRCVHGDTQLVAELQHTVCEAAQGNAIFLANLAANALKLTPPLGFFKHFVVDHSGEHKNTFDMKLRGIMPINDIARIYALSVGSTEIRTLERLNATADEKLMALKDTRNLIDAHEFISRLRLEHQGELMRQGKKADNYLDPSQLSSLARHQLKDAFNVVADAQSGLRLKFTHGMM